MTIPHFTVAPQARRRIVAQLARESCDIWLSSDHQDSVFHGKWNEIVDALPDSVWTPVPDPAHEPWDYDYTQALHNLVNHATVLRQASTRQVQQAIDRKRRKFRLMPSDEYGDTMMKEATTRGPCDVSAGTGKDRKSDFCSVCNDTDQIESINLDQLDFDALMFSEFLSPKSTDEEGEDAA